LKDGPTDHPVGGTASSSPNEPALEMVGTRFLKPARFKLEHNRPTCLGLGR
jgi:hypothetical protein